MNALLSFVAGLFVGGSLVYVWWWRHAGPRMRDAFELGRETERFRAQFASPLRAGEPDGK